MEVIGISSTDAQIPCVLPHPVTVFEREYTKGFLRLHQGYDPSIDEWGQYVTNYFRS